MSCNRQQNESAAQFEARAIQQGQQAGISAVERAREIARQVAERQQEIAADQHEATKTRQRAIFEMGTVQATQAELRQLLAVKLRTLACDVEGIGTTRPANSAEIRRGVDRLRDIAGAME